MFLVTCPVTDTTRLVGTHAIRENANTPHGVLTVVDCPCGGAAILRHGDQVAHRTPDADTVTTPEPTRAIAA